MNPRFASEQEELDWLTARNRQVQKWACRAQLAILGGGALFTLCCSPIFIGHAVTAYRLIQEGLFQ